ncbi:hypothetical protein Pse7367_1793 [Thalassoporum mexicanum PCC 7367]|uniref:hypothetical protein n=1 Tax=Thalassoporum mexicanum TaxID=3457544 RepID=UPI00029FDF0A|nr:hypothetical protein [Pseudanabaena sp. PCC 7367]AFY70070.1 hypothetical protein Pse7367_1793 [Pseudanabaena sp. PCC 7367]
MKLNALAIALTAIVLGALPAQADTAPARCDYYKKGEDKVEVSMSCTFSQRQGFVSIQWHDGVRNEFTPVGDQPGEYTDRRGGRVYRELDALGNAGQVFRMENGSIFVYWQ